MPDPSLGLASQMLTIDKNRPGSGRQVMLKKPLEIIEFEVDLKSIEERVAQSLKDIPLSTTAPLDLKKQTPLRGKSKDATVYDDENFTLRPPAPTKENTP